MGWLGACVVAVMLIACLGSLPWTFGRVPTAASTDDQTARVSAPRRFEATNLDLALLPPSWAGHDDDESARRLAAAADSGILPSSFFGTDKLGRSVFVRCLAGGGISLTIGLAASLLSVLIGTTYGMLAGYLGGRTDAVLMRIVDILYGLPYILLVVLLAVAVDGMVQNIDEHVVTAQQGQAGSGSAWVGLLEFLQRHKQSLNILTLLVAIGGVSWLTMARVIRGQVLSLKEQPFLEASRAIGVPLRRQLTHHLLPNLLGPIIVYATLTVPQAILSESFLSFLGIGVKEPLPSWGNLASDGLSELNIVRTRWWLLFWPCVFVAMTLLALNFVGEGLREAYDPRRRRH